MKLNEQIKQFDTFKISEQKFQEIKENVTDLKNKFNEMLKLTNRSSFEINSLYLMPKLDKSNSYSNKDDNINKS